MLGQSNCLNFTAPYITQQGVLLSSWLGILCLISTWTHIQDSQPRQAEGRQNISLGSISNPFKNRRRSEFSRAEVSSAVGLGAWFPLWPGQGKSSGSITTRTAQAGVTSVCPWYGVWWGLELPVLEINIESKRERGCSFLLLILFLCTTASTHYSYDFTNMHKSDHAPRAMDAVLSGPFPPWRQCSSPQSWVCRWLTAHSSVSPLVITCCWWEHVCNAWSSS